MLADYCAEGDYCATALEMRCGRTSFLMFIGLSQGAMPQLALSMKCADFGTLHHLLIVTCCFLQVVLLSATMPADVLEVTKKFMREPIRILVKKEELTLEGIKQFYINVEREVGIRIRNIWQACSPRFILTLQMF